MSVSKNIHPKFHVSNSNDFVSVRNGITFEQAFLLLSAMRNNMMTPNSCWGEFRLDMDFHENQDRYGALRFDDLRMSSDFQDMKMCCACPTDKIDTPSDKMMLCRDKLAAGECKDEFMRKTMGAILFPQHYVQFNKKQK